MQISIKKLILIISLLFGGLFVVPTKAQAFSGVFSTAARFEACFTPSKFCLKLIIDQINKAKVTIDVQAHEFDSKEVANALARAHQRGVLVRIILDKKNFSGPHNNGTAKFFHREGIPLWKDVMAADAHNTLMIFDNKIVQIGSMYYVDEHQRINSENIMLIYDEMVAQVFYRNWEVRRRTAKRMKRL